MRELLDGVHEELSLHVFYAQVGLHTLMRRSACSSNPML